MPFRQQNRECRMSRMANVAFVLVAVAAGLQMAARAEFIALPLPMNGRAVTPADMAVQVYNEGIEHRDRGLEAEARAAKAASDADRARYQQTARAEYSEAFDRFSDAAELDPSMPQAWNARGFIYRKLGDYESALVSYDHALKLAPNFPDAIEYRGEACLALNRLDEAKQAYLTLFALDRAQAGLLMDAMIRWVASRKADPAGVDPSAVAAFEAWVEERAELARQTRAMAQNTAGRGW